VKNLFYLLEQIPELFNQNINKSSKEGNGYMGFFSLFRNFRKKGNLLSTTQDMISKVRELITKEEIITQAEFNKVNQMFKHLIEFGDKLMEHDELLNSINPKDKRRLAVLQAELGDVEGLRIAIQQLEDELDRSTNLQEELNRQIREEANARINAIEQARRDNRPDESPEVQRILDSWRKKK